MAEPETFEPDGSGHEWWRTIPTDGMWCKLCGLSYARWSGDSCPRDGVLAVLEGKIVELRARLAAVEELADGYGHAGRIDVANAITDALSTKPKGDA